MTIVEYIALIIIGIYSVTILLFSFGWNKIQLFSDLDTFEPAFVSVIIACRNEEENVLSLLESLKNQAYPEEKFEVIIINDHSQDNTKNLVSRHIQNHKNIYILDLPKNRTGKTCLPTGKKEALAYGIKHSKSEIIITTDADCTMKPDWLKTLIQYHTKHKSKILVGPVAIDHSKNFFHKLQTLEFSSLIGSGAGAIGQSQPIMCNGANLLFEKSLYENSNTENSLASGDDIFLMLHAKKEDKKSILFLKSKKAIVFTKPAKSIKDFLNQRVRWTSKSKAYRDFDIIFTALIVTLANLILATSFIYSFWDNYFFKIFALLFVTKSIFDLMLLIPVSSFFKQQKLLWLFLPLQLIYPFYIVMTVIFGLIGNFSWKNRKFQEKR